MTPGEGNRTEIRHNRKKTMKRLFITVMLGFVYNLSHAQNSGGPPPMPGPEQRLKHLESVLKRKLNTSPEQWLALENAFKDFFAKADKLRTDNPPPPPTAEMQQSMKKFEADRDSAIQKILDENQFSAYKKVESQLRPPKGPPPGGE